MAGCNLQTRLGWVETIREIESRSDLDGSRLISGKNKAALFETGWYRKLWDQCTVDLWL